MAGRDTRLPILFDDDVRRLARMPELIEVCREAVDADASGSLAAPPRQVISIHDRKLVFTVGGDDEVVGFRAYELMEGSRQEQIVAVWETDTGGLAGVVIGKLLGAYRTGALGGVAIDLLAPPAATTCAVIGTGLQATTQLLAAAAARPLEQVWCFSRNEQARDDFADRMQETIGVDVAPTRSASYAVTDAEIVIVATDSRDPVVALADVRPDAHVSTIGPKSRKAHELPEELVDTAWKIASDSPQQIAAQGDDHFVTNRTTHSRIQHLGELEPLGAERPGRTCYLSAGLAGTEVLVASHLFEKHR